MPKSITNLFFLVIKIPNKTLTTSPPKPHLAETTNVNFVSKEQAFLVFHQN